MSSGSSTAAGALALILALAFSNGGYGATAWGWSSAALAWTALLALVLGAKLRPGRAGLVALAALAAFVGWTALSAVWSQSVPQTALAVELGLVYLAGLAALLLVASPGAFPALVAAGAVAATVVAAAGLIHRIGFSGPTLTGDRGYPIGYDNGAAAVAAIGIVLVLGLARRRPIVLALLAVLVPALLLLHSSGALLALALGLAAALACARPRLGVPLLAAAIVATAIALPLSIAGTPRASYWGVGAHEVGRAPLLGTGAGTFGQRWLQDRAESAQTRNAHSLYLETLSEVGPIGLAALLMALAIPLIAAARARRRSLAPAALGGYVVFLVHAGLDWDWQLPAVGVLGLLCGGALLLEERRPLRLPSRVVAAAVGLGIVGVTLFGLAANASVSAAAADSRRGDYRSAERNARRAIRLAPWDSQGWARLGDAQLAERRDTAAATSYRRGIEKDPHAWELWLGLERASTGAEQRAARAEARRLDPLGPPGTG
ncbi:MAG: hypothetical protein ACR2MU_05805 [Gaiellaceae bacterium]